MPELKTRPKSTSFDRSVFKFDTAIFPANRFAPDSAESLLFSFNPSSKSPTAPAGVLPPLPSSSIHLTTIVVLWRPL